MTYKSLICLVFILFLNNKDYRYAHRMSCSEILKIQEKLQRLFDILSTTIPAQSIQDHPFDFYKDRLDELHLFLDKIIHISENERERIEKKAEDTKSKILEYSKQLGLVAPQISEFYNLNLYNEFLENEMKRILAIRSRAQSEIVSLVDEISAIKNWLGIKDSAPVIPVDEISLERINYLRMQLAELNISKNEREKMRQYFYDEIQANAKILGEKVEFTFEEKICELERLMSDLKNRIEERRRELKELKDDILRREQTLKVQPREWDDCLDKANIEKMKIYHEHLKSEQNRLFDEIFANTKKELEEINAIFGIKNSEFEKTEKSLDEMRNLINELLPKKDMFCEIRSLINKRKLLLEKMTEFEKIASDPKRLFKSSFQLNSEEKFRNTAYPSLLKIEESLMDLLHLYESTFGVFEYEGLQYKDSLKLEIENRIINRTIFISRCDSPFRKKK